MRAEKEENEEWAEYSYVRHHVGRRAGWGGKKQIIDEPRSTTKGKEGEREGREGNTQDGVQVERGGKYVRLM